MRYCVSMPHGDIHGQFKSGYSHKSMSDLRNLDFSNCNLDCGLYLRLDSHIVFWADPLHFAHNGLHLAVLSMERHCKIKASNRILCLCVCVYQGGELHIRKQRPVEKSRKPGDCQQVRLTYKHTGCH